LNSRKFVFPAVLNKKDIRFRTLAALELHQRTRKAFQQSTLLKKVSKGGTMPKRKRLGQIG
jgi:hypothetical protein